MSSFISVFEQIAPKVFGVGMVPSGGDALGCTRGRGALAAIIGRGRITGDKAEVVEIVGLYWHFVDVVWVVIFTLVYLIPA